MPQRSYGLIIETPSETDYVAGDGNLSGEVINPEGDWTPFIPKFEHQAPLFETNSCASQATMNAVEGLFKLIFGEEPNHSDRMVAKGSGTDPAKGNSPQKVGYFFHKNWSVLEEDWPMEGVQTVEEYYKEFPDLLYSKAEIVRGDSKFGYEAITNPTKLKLKDALTKGAVCISVKAWGQDENGLYYAPPTWTDNHYVWLLTIKPNGNYLIFDSYTPAIKEYRGDAIPAIAYRYTLNEEQVDWIITAIKSVIKKIQDFLATQPVPPLVKPRSRITEWALAIQHAEGGKPQDRNMRDHNPGNIKYTEYTASLGLSKGDAAPDGGYYGRAATYEIGLKVLCSFLKDACEGKLRAYKPTMTLDEFSSVFANVPRGHGYNRTVAQRLGVPLSTVIHTLL